MFVAQVVEKIFSQNPHVSELCPLSEWLLRKNTVHKFPWMGDWAWRNCALKLIHTHTAHKFIIDDEPIFIFLFTLKWPAMFSVSSLHQTHKEWFSLLFYAEIYHQDYMMMAITSRWLVIVNKGNTCPFHPLASGERVSHWVTIEVHQSRAVTAYN